VQQEHHDDANEIALSEAATLFGEIAKALGLLSSQDIINALGNQEERELSARPPTRIGDILVAQGKLTEENVRQVLEEQEHLERANIVSPEKVRGYFADRKTKELSIPKVDSSVAELAARVVELERKLVDKERVEAIAAGAALDVLKLYEKDIREAMEATREVGRTLEKRAFARKVAESLSSLVCRKAIEEPIADVVHYEFERAIEARAQDVFAAELQTPKFAKCVREISGASKDIESASRRLGRRLDQIEQEALPKRLEKLFNEKLEQKLGDVSPEAIAQRLDTTALRRQMLSLARDTMQDLLTSGELRAVINDSIFQAAMTNIVKMPEFKALLDEKFKIMTDYLAEEVIPKRVKRLKEEREG
jgi:enamine deaminase RidA (YjgF/YER057c/UK114 family)